MRVLPQTGRNVKLNAKNDEEGRRSMSNSRNTKRSLLTSALAMLTCLTMLIGTTFAWFTDTATTAVNKIQSGTLKLSLEYWNGNDWVNANNETLSFKKAAGHEAEEVLWEPGCTYELPKLRISNEGNLALKYKIVITGINGSAKLNQVIDWTMELDNESFIMGSEHQLLAKAGETVDADELVIKGHMQDTANNDYQHLEIEGIGITVYATQASVESDSFGPEYDLNADGTPTFDNWYENSSTTATVTTGVATVIQDKQVDPTVTAVVPADSTSATTLTLVKNKADGNGNITIETGTTVASVDVKLIDENQNKVTAAAGEFFTLTMQFEKNQNVLAFYHNDTPLTKAAAADAITENDMYYYDKDTGIITFTTDDFSRFTAVISNTVFDGGDGKEAHPYLISTGDQACAMENAEGYFKLVDDVVVTNEIYLSGKTVVMDLNGHSITLDYADGVKPNNGSVLYIGGKKSSLTINDSSEAQTGAVYGSSKSYTNKVTSAVRAGNYGKLTINGGHFYGRSQGTSCIFVYTNMSSGSKATVVINGGTFETATPSGGKYFVLNHQDNATAGCTITVNGGTFKNYNPGVTEVDPVNAKTGKIVLGTGCTTTSKTAGSDTWYTVSK